MKIQITLLLIDDEVTGLELGDFSLSHFGSTISSAGHKPSQSMMVFIFLSSLLGELVFLRRAKNNRRTVVDAADSPFSLQLEKRGRLLFIRNANVTMNMPFDEFSEELHASIESWLEIWQPKIDAEDGALCDLLKCISLFRSVFDYPT